jgi:hypothetical protein
VYRYELKGAPVELAEYRSKEKLSVGTRIDEKGQPRLRVRTIVREPFAPFGLEARWFSRAGIADVDLEGPDPADTSAISKGMADQQF